MVGRVASSSSIRKSCIISFRYEGVRRTRAGWSTAIQETPSRGFFSLIVPFFLSFFFLLLSLLVEPLRTQKAVSVPVPKGASRDVVVMNWGRPNCPFRAELTFGRWYKGSGYLRPLKMGVYTRDIPCDRRDGGGKTHNIRPPWAPCAGNKREEESVSLFDVVFVLWVTLFSLRDLVSCNLDFYSATLHGRL